MLAEPLACCLGALTPAGDIDGEDVVVFGAGPIGLLSTFLAARAGARVTAVDPLAARLAHAHSLGAKLGLSCPDELPAGKADLVVRRRRLRGDLAGRDRRGAEAAARS